MVQSSSQIRHVATFFQKLAVLILRVSQKLEGRASSRTVRGWLQPNTTKKRSKPGVYSVADKKVTIQGQTSIRSTIPELTILALRTNPQKGQWPIMALSTRGSSNQITMLPLKIQGASTKSIEEQASTGSRLILGLKLRLMISQYVNRSPQSHNLWNLYAQLQNVFKECFRLRKKSKQSK